MEDYYDSMRKRVEVDYVQKSAKLARDDEYVIRNPKYSFAPKSAEYEPPFSHVCDLYEKAPKYVAVPMTHNKV